MKKIPYRLFMLTLLISLCFQSNTKAAPENNQDKLKVVQDEWNKKVKEIAVSSNAVKDSLGKNQDKIPVAKESNPTLPKTFNELITIKGENIPLNVVLKSISKATGHNIVYGPGVDMQRVVSLEMEDLEIWRALNTVLYPLSFGFKVNNNDLVILASETKVFRVLIPPVSQSFSDSTSNESFVTSGNKNNTDNKTSGSQEVRVGTKILVESSMDHLSFWDDLIQNLQSLISNTAKFSVNKTAGTVVVTDLPTNLERLSEYFKEINSKISQQISVEVKVLEVTLTDERKMGIDWNALAKNLKGIGALSFATNFATNNFTSGDFFTFSGTGKNSDSGTSSSGVNAVIKALETYGKVELVSQPKIMLLNNIPAVLQVGTTKAFVDSSQIQTTQTGTTTALSTSQVQSGVTMRLIGTVDNDDIYLSVTPSVTTIDNIRSVTSGSTTIEAPQTTTKSLNTMVKIKTNETVAIGGLITTNAEKTRENVPGLSRIPVLGRIFEFSQKKNNKTELVIFITPKRS